MFKVEIKNLSISANLGITELERKKSAVLADSEQIAYDVSNDIISRVFGENPLVKDTLKDNIKSMVKR